MRRKRCIGEEEEVTLDVAAGEEEEAAAFDTDAGAEASVGPELRRTGCNTFVGGPESVSSERPGLNVSTEATCLSPRLLPAGITGCRKLLVSVSDAVSERVVNGVRLEENDARPRGLGAPFDAVAAAVALFCGRDSGEGVWVPRLDVDNDEEDCRRGCPFDVLPPPIARAASFSDCMLVALEGLLPSSLALSFNSGFEGGSRANPENDRERGRAAPTWGRKLGRARTFAPGDAGCVAP